MTGRPQFVSLISALLALAGSAAAQAGSPASIALTTSANPALLGTALTLTAVVSPSNATGAVTFYDGVNVLGVAPLNSGQSAITTNLLPCCTRFLSARYNGNTSYSASASSQLKQTIAVPAQNGLNSGANYPTGNNPQAVVIADFNRDGLPDVALADAGDLTVSVLLGTGGGAFGPVQYYSSGAGPYALAAGDFNGDGKPDLVVANCADSTVSILTGNGDGTFQPPVAYPVGSDPVAIVAADFNGDGITDFATANFNDNTITVFLGNGDGTLRASGTFAAGSGPVSIVAADFNQDGKPDLAVANSNDNTISILMGAGDGTFAPAVAVTGGLGPFGIVAADFNGDGIADLAVADYGAFNTQLGGGVLVLPGTGSGTFGSPVSSPAGPTPQAIAAGDLNGDGILDLAVANQSGISLLTGNGDGSFQAPAPYATGSSTIALALADVNADSLTDVAVANFNDNSVSILTGNPGVCAYTISSGPPASAPHLWDASGGSFVLNVASNSPGCTWTASADPWITPSTYSLLGSGPVNVTIQGNSTGTARSGSFSIGGQSYSISQTVTSQTFADVPLGAYFFDAVNLLKDKNITSGCGPDLYCPTELIDRAQMAIFLVRAVYGGDNFSASTTPYFADVTPSTFGFAWIQKLFELGISTGCGSGFFCPTGLVSRDQMAVFVIRTRYGASATFPWPPAPYFTDVSTSFWAFDWIQRLKADSITGGCSATLYCPGNPVTRGDMAIFLMRGAFNELLAPGIPFITQINPSVIAAGQTTTVTVTGVNTTFQQNVTAISPIPGVQIGAITVASPTSLQVTLSAAATPSTQPLSIVAITGSELAVLPNVLSIQ